MSYCSVVKPKNRPFSYKLLFLGEPSRELQGTSQGSLLVLDLDLPMYACSFACTLGGPGGVFTRSLEENITTYCRHPRVCRL